MTGHPPRHRRRVQGPHHEVHGEGMMECCVLRCLVHHGVLGRGASLATAGSLVACSDRREACKARAVRADNASSAVMSCAVMATSAPGQRVGTSFLATRFEAHLAYPVAGPLPVLAAWPHGVGAPRCVVPAPPGARGLRPCLAPHVEWRVACGMGGRMALGGGLVLAARVMPRLLQVPCPWHPAPPLQALRQNLCLRVWPNDRQHLSQLMRRQGA